MWFYLFTFAFVAKSKKSLLRPLWRSLPPRFSFRRFMVSGLTFKSLIHLELILAYCIRWRCKSSWLQQYFEVYSVWVISSDKFLSKYFYYCKGDCFTNFIFTFFIDKWKHNFYILILYLATFPNSFP